MKRIARRPNGLQLAALVALSVATTSVLRSDGPRATLAGGGPAAGAPSESARPSAAHLSPAQAAQPGSGAWITLFNNLPSPAYITTQPDLRRLRSPWGGGALPLGPGRVTSFQVTCSDSVWTYTFEVTCPTGDDPCVLRLSDVWNGYLPAGFTVRRGEPSRTGEMVWSNESGPSVPTGT